MWSNPSPAATTFLPRLLEVLDGRPQVLQLARPALDTPSVSMSMTLMRLSSLARLMASSMSFSSSLARLRPARRARARSRVAVELLHDVAPRVQHQDGVLGHRVPPPSIAASRKSTTSMEHAVPEDPARQVERAPRAPDQPHQHAMLFHVIPSSVSARRVSRRRPAG